MKSKNYVWIVERANADKKWLPVYSVPPHQTREAALIKMRMLSNPWQFQLRVRKYIREGR